ncbi:MAG: hypothetical protein E7389_05550 [Ruminococcaceae bacterium]|nr:hypothetical protein [Oscillospiraceae bacterium]
MRISIRLNEQEEEKIKDLQAKTGLSVTALVKKGLFDRNEGFSSSIIIKELGDISTSVNLAKNAAIREDNNLAMYHLTAIEKGVGAIWRSL